MITSSNSHTKPTSISPVILVCDPPVDHKIWQFYNTRPASFCYLIGTERECVNRVRTTHFLHICSFTRLTECLIRPTGFLPISSICWLSRRVLVFDQFFVRSVLMSGSLLACLVCLLTVANGLGIQEESGGDITTISNHIVHNLISEPEAHYSADEFIDNSFCIVQ